MLKYFGVTSRNEIPSQWVFTTANEIKSRIQMNVTGENVRHKERSEYIYISTEIETGNKSHLRGMHSFLNGTTNRLTEWKRCWWYARTRAPIRKTGGIAKERQRERQWKKGKWRVNLIFDLRWKCTRTLIGQVAGQHLSSSSAVETNREYLIRKTERHQANIHCMPVPWYISISNIGSVLNKRRETRNENGMNKHNTITKCHASEPEHSVSAGWRLALVCYWHPFSFYLLHTSSLSMFDLFDVVFFSVNIFNKIECDSGHIPRLSVPRMLLHVDTATSRQNALLRHSIFSHFFLFQILIVCRFLFIFFLLCQLWWSAEWLECFGAEQTCKRFSLLALSCLALYHAHFELLALLTNTRCVARFFPVTFSCHPNKFVRMRAWALSHTHTHTVHYTECQIVGVIS